MRVVSLSVNVMISCHDWKLGRPYVHNLRTCEQVHFCELGTENLAVESPSSEEKWLFLAGWRLLFFAPAWQAQKREGDWEREKISLFPFLPMLYHFTQAAGSVFAGCCWVVASLKIHQVWRIMQCVNQDELGSLCCISILPIFRNNGQNRFNLLALCTSSSIFAGGSPKRSLDCYE